MSQAHDRHYLRTVQYRDSSNLDARIALHRRFSTNPDDFYLWVYDRLSLSPGERVLEVGCGPGRMWMENVRRIQPDLHITLTDLSPGMLAQAERNLVGTTDTFSYGVADAQALPLDRDSFDVVIANHMLYHVPDKGRALSEIRRVLRNGGRFYAATNGQKHMRELDELAARFDPSFESQVIPPSDFTLENGPDEIARWFDNVTLHRYEDGLIVTEAQPLAAYVLSMVRGRRIDASRLAEFIDQELEEHGPIRITKDTGLFEAR